MNFFSSYYHSDTSSISSYALKPWNFCARKSGLPDNVLSALSNLSPFTFPLQERQEQSQYQEPTQEPGTQSDFNSIKDNTDTPPILFPSKETSDHVMERQRSCNTRQKDHNASYHQTTLSQQEEESFRQSWFSAINQETSMNVHDRRRVMSDFASLNTTKRKQYVDSNIDRLEYDFWRWRQEQIYNEKYDDNYRKGDVVELVVKCPCGRKIHANVAETYENNNHRFHYDNSQLTWKSVVISLFVYIALALRNSFIPKLITVFISILVDIATLLDQKLNFRQRLLDLISSMIDGLIKFDQDYGIHTLLLDIIYVFWEATFRAIVVFTRPEFKPNNNEPSSQPCHESYEQPRVYRQINY